MGTDRVWDGSKSAAAGLLALAISLGLTACGYEDRSPTPQGNWTAVLDGEHGGVDFTVWQAEATKEGRTCMSIQLAPEPSPPLPSNDERALHEGREFSCLELPSDSEPLQVMWDSHADRYGFLYLLTPEGSTASMTLNDRTVVQNAAAGDTSNSVNLFMGFYEAGRRPVSIDLAGPAGDRQCTFENDSETNTITITEISCSD